MNWVIIGSGNGLSPVRRQAITWTNADLLLIGPFGTNFNEIRIEIQNFSFTKMHLKRLSAKWRPFCPGGDELMNPIPDQTADQWITSLITGVHVPQQAYGMGVLHAYWIMGWYTVGTLEFTIYGKSWLIYLQLTGLFQPVGTLEFTIYGKSWLIYLQLTGLFQPVGTLEFTIYGKSWLIYLQLTGLFQPVSRIRSTDYQFLQFHVSILYILHYFTELDGPGYHIIMMEHNI